MLGLARRNVARHAAEAFLAVASLAIAAGLLTAALTLQRGVPAGFDPALRAFLGGDVIFWTGEAPAPVEEIRTGPGGSAVGRSGPIRLVPVPDDGTVTLSIFWPDLGPGGAYLSRDPIRPTPVEGAFPPPSLAGEAALATGTPFGGARWYPRLVIPALAPDGPVWIVARFPGQTDPALWRTLGGDPWPRTLETGEGAALHVDAAVPRSLPASSLTLVVPRAGGVRPDGAAVWDWTRTEVLAVTTRARYEVPLGSPQECRGADCAQATTPVTPQPANRRGASPPTVQPTWPARDLLVPWSQWRALWAREAPGLNPAARQWTVRLADTTRARDLALAVTRTGAGTALTVHDAWASGTARPWVSMEDGHPVTTWTAVGPAHVGQPSGWLAWLALLLAALLLGGQMVALVGRRRHELGVLMAIGASTGDVVRLVTWEALGYALAGGAAGFVLITLFTLPATVAGASVPAWFLAAGERFLEVVAASAAAAVLAASLPVLLATRANVTEVIRDE